MCRHISRNAAARHVRLTWEKASRKNLALRLLATSSAIDSSTGKGSCSRRDRACGSIAKVQKSYGRRGEEALQLRRLVSV
ncbi:hypothetical protein Micbo1qcDRAFT_166167 [Microdochium bolleyi]|uniref:Uncharacterized protein n=1 Tax=Microdochium bolleyi TaxID=196109 RepID=A0A136IV95_9PEZI|nr:hypothetical protein Micbo1qcDRAFT_166167 [Microdochium bolleyi]